MSNGIDYTKTCFVIMPFGKKPVGERTVDFNAIYDGIFEPAIRATMLPEGGNLEPRRTDKDFFVGDISQEMFQYLEYSRFALADITGLTPMCSSNSACGIAPGRRAPRSSGSSERHCRSTSIRSKRSTMNTSPRQAPSSPESS